MFKFGKNSMKHLSSCDPDLQKVALEAIKTSKIDFCIICGHRGEKAQNAAVAAGFSEVKFPDGNHNEIPSDALDFAPYYNINPHIRWDKVDDFVYVADHIIKTGEEMGIPLRSGSDWDRDGVYREKGESDGPHIEKVKVKKTSSKKKEVS